MLVQWQDTLAQEQRCKGRSGFDPRARLVTANSPAAIEGMFREYRTHVLRSRQVAVHAVLPGDFVRDSLAFEAHRNNLFDDMLMRLSAHVLSDQLVSADEEVTLDVPASWWQHLKLSHAPEWFKRRWPVVCATWRKDMHFERHRTYPEADVVLPREKYGHPVYVEAAHYGPWRAPDGGDWRGR